MALPWQNKLWDPDNAQQGLSARWNSLAPTFMLAQSASDPMTPRPPWVKADSPQYLIQPETGDEPVDPGFGYNAVQTPGDPRLTAMDQQLDALGNAMDAAPEGSPKWMALLQQHSQLSMARQTYVGAGPQVLAQSPADIIQGAVNARQAAPRQSFRPPAPGGIPTGIPEDSP